MEIIFKEEEEERTFKDVTQVVYDKILEYTEKTIKDMRETMKIESDSENADEFD